MGLADVRNTHYDQVCLDHFFRLESRTGLLGFVHIISMGVGLECCLVSEYSICTRCKVKSPYCLVIQHQYGCKIRVMYGLDIHQYGCKIRVMYGLDIHQYGCKIRVMYGLDIHQYRM